MQQRDHIAVMQQRDQIVPGHEFDRPMSDSGLGAVRPNGGGVVGYTTGVYDLFHVGHLNLLRRAKESCDHLIVGVTTDELSLARKARRPVVPFSERCEIVAAIRVVDEVVGQSSMDKLEAWQSLHFHRMYVGDDWKGTDAWALYERELAGVGVTVSYLPYTTHVSTTQLRTRASSSAAVS